MIHKILPIEPFLQICIININDFIFKYLKAISVQEFRVQKNRFFSPVDIDLALFSAAEFERLNSFKTLKKQIEWMCGRFAVKQLVCGFGAGEVGPAAIQIDYHDKGAPFLTAFPAWHISISHSHDYAVAGLSCREDVDIGLDIEKIEKKNLKFIRNVAFTDREKQYWAADDYSGLYSCWTVKEAYLKYLKQGFNESLQKVEVIGDTLFYDQQAVTGLKIFSSEIRRGYAFTLLYDEQPSSSMKEENVH